MYWSKPLKSYMNGNLCRVFLFCYGIDHRTLSIHQSTWENYALVGELTLQLESWDLEKTRKLDEGCREKEAAHNLLAFRGSAPAHAFGTYHTVLICRRFYNSLFNTYQNCQSCPVPSLQLQWCCLTWLEGREQRCCRTTLADKAMPVAGNDQMPLLNSQSYKRS